METKERQVNTRTVSEWKVDRHKIATIYPRSAWITTAKGGILELRLENRQLVSCRNSMILKHRRICLSQYFETLLPD
jgi:hypothetical protein